MLIKNKRSWELTDNDATPESVYRQRRQILKALGITAATAPFANPAKASLFDWFDSEPDTVFERQTLDSKPDSSELVLTPEDKILQYNNFYEFGTDKTDPAKRSQGFVVDPWTLTIGGLVGSATTLGYDDLFRRFALEERIYRLRCVEAWSMNIPWIGFPLADLIKMANPQTSAKYVAFETLHDPEQMPGQASRRLGGGIDYPYVEGLRLDEALNPLTILAVGLYGKTLAPQNGAPIRLVVPWKYGFKSIKSVVKISLTEQRPPTTWSSLAPSEYGFYANVNPTVDHPRWSQASERHIGKGSILSTERIPTLMFNGYQDEVGQLYADMDLRKWY